VVAPLTDSGTARRASPPAVAAGDVAFVQATDLRPWLDSGEASVAYVQITSATRASYTLQSVVGEHSSFGAASVFDGTIEGVLLRSEDLVAMRPEDVIARYVAEEEGARLVQGWTEANGESVCRLYEGNDGREHLLLCQLFASANRFASTESPTASSARTIEKRPDALRVGVKCAEHDTWVLHLLLPPELESCASPVLTRVLATAEGRHLWCQAGRHGVAAPPARE
jgi:hypothetical protein